MSIRSLIDSVIGSGLGDGSDENLLRLLKAGKKLDSNFELLSGVRGYSRDLQLLVDGIEGRRERSPHLNLLKAVLGLDNKTATYRFSRNIIYNAGFIGNKRRTKFESEHGFRSPSFIVISPTMQCNLSCTGCYAGEYKRESLDYEVVDRVIREGKQIGAYFYVITGGEAFMWNTGGNIFDLFKAHQDAYFLVYTNGTLINKEKASELGKLGNVAPGISVEGFEKETDERRGAGIHKKVLNAMKLLQEQGIFFGFSTMVTKQNEELVSSDEFIDFYYDRGCRFGWYFQFLPIGKEPDVEMMASPEQRQHLRKRINKIRDRKRDMALTDFWNDGCLMGGCIAAGKHYLHINANGDAEPCAFVHFAVDNIKGKSLVEVLNSDFFSAIRKRQPYSPNLYAPCMIIDNPKILREVVGDSRVRATHYGAECVTEDEKITSHLNKYAEEVHALTAGLENPFKID